MKTATAVIIGAWLIHAALASPTGISTRDPIGQACSGKNTLQPGTCQDVQNCKGISHPEWYCPGGDNIQCCVEIPCTGHDGMCKSIKHDTCADGQWFEGEGPNWPCPGDNNIQCCLNSPSGDAPVQTFTGGMQHAGGGGGGATTGEKILAKAMTQEGQPYAWGGGSCRGPTGDQKPWDYGETGFDCSGLVAWAVCQVTGRDLFAEGKRNTIGMYCRAGYNRVPYAQRRVGDAVFFNKVGGKCACESITHMGLVMHDLNMMWNAPDDQVNSVGPARIKKPCDMVVRF